MRLTYKLTNRAILLSETIRGDEWDLECEADDLSYDERDQIAARLYDDRYTCEGVVNDEGGVEPRLDQNGQPVLLRVDGTELGDLTDALEKDQKEVEEHLGTLAKNNQPKN